MATTANKIITGALRLLKVKEAGEPADASELEDGLEALNELIQSWNNQKLMIPSLTQITHTLVSGTGNYTMGTGGDITTRPQKITSGTVKGSDNYEYILNRIYDQQYNDIQLKTLSTTYPYYYYYQTSYPLATLKLWPIPNQNYTLTLNVWDKLTEFATGASVVDLPPGYEKALRFNLAVAISPEYRMPDTYGETKATALEEKAWIKRVNKQDRMVMYTPVSNVTTRYTTNSYRGNV